MTMEAVRNLTEAEAFRQQGRDEIRAVVAGIHQARTGESSAFVGSFCADCLQAWPCPTTKAVGL